MQVAAAGVGIESLQAFDLQVEAPVIQPHAFPAAS